MVSSNLENLRHSLAHLLAMAVLQEFPDAKLGVGPVVDNGFYYDFLLPKPLTQENLKSFERAMRKMAGQRMAFEGEDWPVEKAREYFKNQPFKLELIKEKSNGQTAQVYKTGKFTPTPNQMTDGSKSKDESMVWGFIDFCKGGHVQNTGEIDPRAFKLTAIAGAYWKGDEKREQLQRVYGVAFEKPAELEAYLKQIEEAKKRDHRKLGKELDLFVFSELVGPGLPLWTPKGTLLRNILDDFVWQLRRAKGYEKVEIPHITKKDLFEISGHWDKFKDELFKITTREGHVFAMKPMNCPLHTQIFSSRPRSYREMPQRYANTTMCYRDEQTGELFGLSRGRAFTQDDAHVFCRKDQIEPEMFAVWDIIEEFYKAFGFELKVRLSLHDPQAPEKYLGKHETWLEAEALLRTLAKKRGVEVVEALGEAAFYGPKIDFMAHDSIGRPWQVATIQLDFNMPERFDLTFINEQGAKERLFMIHCAIMGSIERFLSIVIEHFSGAFPLWLSPVQVAVLPVSQNHEAYAKEIVAALQAADIRVELYTANETLGKRIRLAEQQKTPYIAVVGEKEMADKTLTIRGRGGKDLGGQKIENFTEDLKRQIHLRSV